jgi:hypothetical protein
MRTLISSHHRRDKSDAFRVTNDPLGASLISISGIAIVQWVDQRGEDDDLGAEPRARYTEVQRVILLILMPSPDMR